MGVILVYEVADVYRHKFSTEKANTCLEKYSTTRSSSGLLELKDKARALSTSTLLR